jgi:hypothetical protein
LSLVELSKFAMVMFPKDHSQFSRHELSWVATMAKSEPISAENWHGDIDGDAQQVRASARHNPTQGAASC